jgi:replicative DNA helicase
MIAACGLPRSVEERQNKRPSLRDLKQAKAADAIIFLYRDSYYNPDSKFRGKAEIIIERQRHGPTGTLDFVYESNVGRFLQFQ